MGLITPEDSRYASGGVTRRVLMNIPILLVGMDAMNENVKHRPSGEYDPSGAVTRGMCLSERIRPRGSGGGGGGKDFDVTVTAILCLCGLPADLTASILAHGEVLHGMNLTKTFFNSLVASWALNLTEQRSLLVFIYNQTPSNRGIPCMDQVTSQLLACQSPPAQGGGGVGPADGIPIFGWAGSH